MRVGLITLLLCCFAATGVFAEPASVGKISRYRGGAFAINEGESRNLQLGAELREGDRIVTGENTRVEMEMIDGALITLGDFTYFKVKAYAFDQAASAGRAEVSMLRGVFRAVTGKLGKLAGAPFKVETPLASIGIRGTDFWGEQTAALFEVALLGGTAIIVSNEQGEVEVNQVGTGTTILPGKGPATPVPWGNAKLNRAQKTVD